MSVGERLREERLRLGASQQRLADITGVAKNTAINWEKDASSPTANALIAFAEAGADALYILTGRRTPDRPEEVTKIEDQLAWIRRDMLVTAWESHAGEGASVAEAGAMRLRADRLQALLDGKGGPLSPEQREEVESLLAIITNPVQLAGFRAADLVQRRSRRRQLREQIHAYTDLGDYQPNEAALNTMTTIALDYSVPVDLLAELVYDIAASDPVDQWGAMRPET